MKKTLITLSVLVASVFILQAQDRIVTFSGSDTNTTVDSVTVQNLTKGTTIKMGGQDTLVLTKTTGVNPVNDIELLPLTAYPNPFSSECKLILNVPNSEDVLIRIFGISGNLIASSKVFLEKGYQSFRLQGLQSGIYVVKVNSSLPFQTAKILSINTSTGNPEIVHEGQHQSVSQLISPLKSSQNEPPQTLAYEEGDEIMITGESTDPITGQTSATVETFEISEATELEENIEFEFIECVDNNGKSYATVEIGDQIWMTENYAFDTGESSWAYDQDEDNVNTYGRLYTWEAALNNAPAGWHLPTLEDWNQLKDFITQEYNEKLMMSLKNISGWQPDDNDNPGNGTNSSGYSALPGGARWFVDGTFYNLGKAAYFWTATESESTHAYIKKLTNTDNEMGEGSSDKQYGFSVRYIKNSSTPEVETYTASEITNKSALLKGTITSNGGSAVTECGIVWSNTNKTPDTDDNIVLANVSEGEFTIPMTDLKADSSYYFRAFASNANGIALGKVLMFKTNSENDTIKYGSVLMRGGIYKTITIGEQTWMAENFRYLPGITPIADISEKVPLCYVYAYTTAEENMAFYSKYGALYNWPAAIAYCPDGWHLPSGDDWTQLEDFVTDNWQIYGGLEGLAAKTDWYDVADNEGFNSTGFSAVPGGMAQNEIESYVHAGRTGYYWTSDKGTDAWGNEILAHHWNIAGLNNRIEVWGSEIRQYRGMSVRYIKDKQ